MVRSSRVVEVAAGVFAPGHLGALTPLVPFELVDALLQEARRMQQRVRRLPSRVGVYLVLAMVLFPQAGLVGVWQALVAGLPSPVAACSEKALRDLRRRVGVEPIRALFDTVCGPLSRPGMAGVTYRRWRTVAFDGCASFKVPDSAANRGFFGRRANGHGELAYPMLMLMALVETGTRAVLGAVFGPDTVSELDYAARLFPLLGADMLVLADRAFDADAFLIALAETEVQFCIRFRTSRRPPVVAVLPDGSFLTVIEGRTLRVVRATVAARLVDGTAVADTWCLITTLTCHRTDPARQLLALYHERWEIETTFLALRHTLCGRPVLRSGDPDGIAQEMWAHLCVYQVLRTIMADAAASAAIDPDRAGFTTALHAARLSVIAADGITCATLDDPITTAVQAAVLPARRPRLSMRKVKSPTSRYGTIAGQGNRPRASTRVTGLDITVHTPDQPALPPLPDTAPETLPILQATAGTALLQALAIIHAYPDQSWRGRDLARNLGINGRKALNTFGVALNTAARRGHIHKTAPGTYTATAP